tara:strand:- start:1605 stop:2843 length:1239 start_codon:yes stop_codon:yes gene_type:complete
MSIQQNFPAISPSLSLNFARSKTLDPRITFTRTSSGTRTNETGLVEVVPANSPRFDHSYDPVSGTVRSLGLLVEEQRINLATYSSDMSQWTTNVSPIYADNDTTAPDGTATADKLTGNNAAADGRYIIVTISANTTYSVASFIKPTDQPRTRIGVYSNVDSWYGNVDTDWDANGEPTTQNSVGASNIKYEPYPNGWYRLSFQFTSPATINGTVEYFHMPDRTATGKSVWFWGAQLEAGAFPTSYIPTSGSTVTRTPDNVSMVGENFSSWYNQSEGTIYVSQKLKSIDNVDRNSLVYLINGGSGTDIFYNVKNGDTNIFVFGDNGTNYSRWQENGDSTDTKAIWAYDVSGDDFKPYWNGIEGINESTSNTPSATSHTQLEIGATVSAKYNGHISQLTYYPRRLTNSNLQNLTK